MENAGKSKGHPRTVVVCVNAVRSPDDDGIATEIAIAMVRAMARVCLLHCATCNCSLQPDALKSGKPNNKYNIIFSILNSNKRAKQERN